MSAVSPDEHGIKSCAWYKRCCLVIKEKRGFIIFKYLMQKVSDVGCVAVKIIVTLFSVLNWFCTEHEDSWDW